ncbi:hypothetical protein BN1708_015616, partial [Verticillium longisporum]
MRQGISNVRRRNAVHQVLPRHVAAGNDVPVVRFLGGKVGLVHLCQPLLLLLRAGLHRQALALDDDRVVNLDLAAAVGAPAGAGHDLDERVLEPRRLAGRSPGAAEGFPAGHARWAGGLELAHQVLDVAEPVEPGRLEDWFACLAGDDVFGNVGVPSSNHLDLGARVLGHNALQRKDLVGAEHEARLARDVRVEDPGEAVVVLTCGRQALGPPQQPLQHVARLLLGRAAAGGGGEAGSRLRRDARYEELAGLILEAVDAELALLVGTDDAQRGAKVERVENFAGAGEAVGQGDFGGRVGLQTRRGGAAGLAVEDDLVLERAVGGRWRGRGQGLDGFDAGDAGTDKVVEVVGGQNGAHRCESNSRRGV